MLACVETDVTAPWSALESQPTSDWQANDDAPCVKTHPTLLYSAFGVYKNALSSSGRTHTLRKRTGAS